MSMTSDCTLDHSARPDGPAGILPPEKGNCRADGKTMGLIEGANGGSWLSPLLGPRRQARS
eukprot:6526783-Alexandrium_andersonii.AAC.1